MSKGWNYKSGDWNIQCDICDMSIKASDAKKRWDGLIVCEHDWEPRHPQDFVRVKPERFGVPFSRPRVEDTFVEGAACTLTTQQGLADIGAADCARVGYNNGLLPGAK